MKKPESTGQQGKSITDAYVQHESAIKRFIGKFLPRPNDIEDVSQEAFLKAFVAEKKHAIDQPKSFLFRVARNVALSHLRQKSRHPTDQIEDFESSDVVATECSSEDQVIAHQQLGIRCDAVADLTPQVRRVYLMRKVYGMSHKEIAERMGITRSTVEKHLTKGMLLCERYVRERTSQEVEGEQNAPQHSSKIKGDQIASNQITGQQR